MSLQSIDLDAPRNSSAAESALLRRIDLTMGQENPRERWS
jgi:hypothetical protein